MRYLRPHSSASPERRLRRRTTIRAPFSVTTLTFTMCVAPSKTVRRSRSTTKRVSSRWISIPSRFRTWTRSSRRSPRGKRTSVKVSPSGGQSIEEIDLALAQLVSDAVGSRGIVDVLEQAGSKRPDISVFSDDFLAEIAGMQQRNLAREMLERLLRDEITSRSRRNAVQARKFSEMLSEAITRYESRS